MSDPLSLEADRRGLNSCYRYEWTDEIRAQGPDGQYHQTASASLQFDLFMRGRGGPITTNGLSEEAFFRRRALAYLAGAWTRYGRNRSFVFANARNKAELISQLLFNLGCRNVRLETTVGLIPSTTMVHFDPTDEVRKSLAQKW